MIDYIDNFNIEEYVSLVNALADGYFDKNGDYVPHFGRLVAMELFYLNCVTEDGYKVVGKHDTNDLNAMSELFKKDEFVEAFYKAMFSPSTPLNFAQAYQDAMSIVDNRKNSFNQMASAIKRVVEDGIDSLRTMFSDENMASLNGIVDAIKDGSLSSESIVAAVQNSDPVKRIFESIE